MSIEEFEEIVERALNDIPVRFREILEKEKIEILAREKVPLAVRDRFKDRLVFGVFVGVSYSKRSTFSIHSEPTRIELYKESFEMAFRDEEAVKQRIRKTVIHEIAHYFGFSEEEIWERGY